MPIMHVHIIEGRTEAQKAAFIAAVTNVALETLDAPAASVRVILHEIPPENFGRAGLSIKQIREGEASGAAS